MIIMKKVTSLLIGCSLALAGAALAQQPVEQQSPSKGKRAPEKARAAQAQPGAPQGRPEKQTGAMKERGATNEPGATTEPGAGKGRKTRASQESATAPGTRGTGGSGEPTGGRASGGGRRKGAEGWGAPGICDRRPNGNRCFWASSRRWDARRGAAEERDEG